MWGFNITGVNGNEHWVCREWDVLSHFSNAQKINSWWSPIFFYAQLFSPQVYDPVPSFQLSPLPSIKRNGTILNPDCHSKPSLLSSQYYVFHGSGWSQILLITNSLSYTQLFSFSQCHKYLEKEKADILVWILERALFHCDTYTPNIQKGSKVSAFALGVLTAAG